MEAETIKNKEQKNSSGTGSYTRGSFPVLGMSCAACAASVESMLKATPGVKDAGVNFATHTAWAEYNSSKASPADLQKAVQTVGYDLIVDVEEPELMQEEAQKKDFAALKSRTIWAGILALPVVALGMIFMHFSLGNWIAMALTAVVVFWLGRQFFINAWNQARHGKANMDTLVALSTGMAFVFSIFNTVYPEYWLRRGLNSDVYFEAAAVIIFFISVGKLLEERAKSNTSTAIRKLMGLQTKTVRVILEGQEVELSIAEVQVGHELVVRPGEMIPLDGVVSEGRSYVDESLISGEPVPVEKKTGANVFAGTLNQKGSFRFKAEKVGPDTVLAQIIRLVKEAQGSKAPVQKLVDKIAGVFVPVVIGIAALTFVVWIVAGGTEAFSHALLSAVTVLVIACPCALGLATPTAIMVGIGKGADNNILIKDAESLELGHRVNAIVLDKTGTITEGRPAVIDAAWLPLPEEEVNRLKSILYTMESQSEHPLAEAVVNWLKEQQVKGKQLGSFESITGRGVRAEDLGEVYYAGSFKLIQEQGIQISDDLIIKAAQMHEQAHTVIYFSDCRQVLAVVAIADKIKPTSKHAIAALQKQNIEVYMLTGDNRQTAKAVAQLLGLNHFEAEMLPTDKAEFIKKLQQEGKVVAMVGDGINDSQALAQADVSIAMGKGADIAMDVAKMVLITSDLQSVPKALLLSRKTVRGIKQNLFWAFIYNIIGIPLAAGILYPFTGFLLNPMIAGAAMALSSVSVVANSLRLKMAKI